MTAAAPPIILPVRAENIPDELRARAQWVLWRGEWDAAKEKLNKIPLNAKTGRLASSTAPSTWSDFATAIGGYKRRGAGCDGIGFVLSADDPFVGVDLDHCRDPKTGDVEAWALSIVKALASYTEITPSATGLRIIARGTLPPDGRKKGNIEMYEAARFLTLTGAVWDDLS